MGFTPHSQGCSEARRYDFLGEGMSVEVIPDIPTQERYLARRRSVDRLPNAASGASFMLLKLANPNLEIPAGVICTPRFPEPVGRVVAVIQAPRLRRNCGLSVSFVSKAVSTEVFCFTRPVHPQIVFSTPP
jgi:hypothetical protein